MREGVHYTAGAVGGFVGGIILGVFNASVGSMQVVSLLAGTTSAAIGWLLQLAATTLIGVLFAWWFGNSIDTYGEGIGYGIVHGIIWWFAAWVIFIPLILGFQTDFTRFLSGGNLIMLLGHVIYGLVLGTVYAMIDRPHAKFHHVPGVR